MFIDLWLRISRCEPMLRCPGPRWGWMSGIFAQIQPLVLSPSKMLRASKIRCSSQLLQTMLEKGLVPVFKCQMGFPNLPKILLICRHSCIDVSKNGVDSCQVHGLLFGETNEFFQEFSETKARCQPSTGGSIRRWCVVCWFVEPRDTTPGTEWRRGAAASVWDSRVVSSQVVNIMLMLGLISSIAFAIYTVGLWMGLWKKNCGMRFFSAKKSGPERKNISLEE